MSSTRYPASSWLCLVFVSPREQFLKSNAQLTFRCRQLLSELSYIYPIDVVSQTTRFPAAQHIVDVQRMIFLWYEGFNQAEMVQIGSRRMYEFQVLFLLSEHLSVE